MWLGLVAFAALLFATVPAAAQAPVRLTESCRIAADANMPLHQAVAALKRCEKSASRHHVGTVWISYDPFDFWLQPAKTWRLTIDNHRSSAVDLWVVRRDGKTEHSVYDPNDPAREWAAGNYQSILFTPKAEVERLVLRLRDAEGVTYVRAPRIARAKSFAPIERDHAAIYGMGVGMLALTILFHLSLFFAMRRRFQLIYCIHVGLLLGYGLGYSGIVHILLPQLSSGAISNLVSFTMAAATATGIAFVVEFLGVVTPLWLRRWAIGASAASATAAFALVLAPASIGYPVFLAANAVAMHAIMLTTVIIFFALFRRQVMAVPLLLGWSLPISVSLMYPARTMGLIGDAALPDGLMMFAATVECLILSLPVASRIRALRLEHERAAERHVLLERQAHTDALTGLANRRGFVEALDRAAIAHAEPFPLALLLIDIDHFKRVNDQHGHATGDAILRHVAVHVARVAGPGAIVGRHGGEEFVVVLRGYDLTRAGTMAERIRIGIGLAHESEPNLPRVTVSIGVAVGDSATVATALQDADCALYRAKNEGRNKVMLADGPLVYAAAA
ncbi:MAG TPA: diguanylate cyclase [Sphingomonas sp.]|nr:diguanylate cyclase [Sphingomonas sp.]